MNNIQIPPNLKNRKILTRIIPFLENDKIILLTGARQTGKTSLLYLLAKELIKRNINSNQLVFLDLENILTLQQLNEIGDFNNFINILKNLNVDINKKTYVFIDEIQYLNNSSSFLKYLHDHYSPKIKFIVSGSSSLEIKKKLTPKLTGRVYRFNIMPLDFTEFLDFSNLPANQAAFEEFCLYGSYPAVSLLHNFSAKQKELGEIYSLYIKRDIQDYGGIDDTVGFNNLVKILAGQIGSLVNELELANTLQLSRQTIKKYLFLLENTFVVNLLKPFYSNIRKELKKMPKVYFVDTGLRNAGLENFSAFNNRMDMGNLVENNIFLEIQKLVYLQEKGQVNFWRTQAKQEVDFIIQYGEKLIPIEVKYTNFKIAKAPKHLKDFIKLYKVPRGLVITKDFQSKIKIANSVIEFVPACKFCCEKIKIIDF